MSNCAPSIPQFVEPECVNELGRVVALALIHKTVHAAIFAAPATAANWVDSNYAADLMIWQEVRGTYSGGEPVEVPGQGNQASRVINASHTLVLRIAGVRDNEDVWDQFAK